MIASALRNALRTHAPALALSLVLLLQGCGDDGEAPTRGEEAADAMDMPGMDMGGQGTGTIQLSAAELATFGVTFGGVEVRDLDESLRTVGIVTFDETRLAAVAPKFGGYLERLYVDFTGKNVRRGEPLVEIYSPELVAAQEELLLAARLERDLAGSVVPGVPPSSSDLLGAARRRLRLWDVTDAQIDEILAAGEPRRTLTLYAPVSGVVIEKSVIEGENVRAGQTLYRIADLSEVWVEAELREGDAGLVAEGDPASVELAAFPGRPLAARIEYVYPTLEERARTLRVRIRVPNPTGRLKPGMYATVRLQSPGRPALTVPSSAVLDTGDRQLVFVDLGGGRILPQEVELGRRTGELSEVLSGLEPGQRVVTSAQFLLDSESNLAEVMRSMIGVMGTADMGGMEGMDVPRDTPGGPPPEER